jgi:hypothetical protein
MTFRSSSTNLLRNPQDRERSAYTALTARKRIFLNLIEIKLGKQIRRPWRRKLSGDLSAMTQPCHSRPVFDPPVSNSLDGALQATNAKLTDQCRLKCSQGAAN